MFPQCRAVSISTSVQSVILGLHCRSLWLQLWRIFGAIQIGLRQLHYVWNMECQHLTCTNLSLPRIFLLVWFCLPFAIFQQVSDLHCVREKRCQFIFDHNSFSYSIFLNFCTTRNRNEYATIACNLLT